MKNVFTFNLGESVRFSRPVSQLLIERLPLTTELALSALAIAVLVGVPLGVIAARRHNTAVDTGTMALANIGVSMPVFWLGLMLAYVFALLLRDTPFALPPSGRISAGVFSTPYFEVWGWQLEEGSSDRPSPRVHRQPLHLQQPHHRPVGGVLGRRQTHDPARHRPRHDPALDHRPHHPQLAARSDGQGLHPHGQGQGRQRAMGGEAAMRSATPSCRSSPSSDCSSVRSWVVQSSLRPYSIWPGLVGRYSMPSPGGTMRSCRVSR